MFYFFYKDPQTWSFWLGRQRVLGGIVLSARIPLKSVFRFGVSAWVVNKIFCKACSRLAFCVECYLKVEDTPHGHGAFSSSLENRKSAPRY